MGLDASPRLLHLIAGSRRGRASTFGDGRAGGLEGCLEALREDDRDNPGSGRAAACYLRVEGPIARGFTAKRSRVLDDEIQMAPPACSIGCSVARWRDY
jgi:hypothetical protein